MRPLLRLESTQDAIDGPGYSLALHFLGSAGVSQDRERPRSGSALSKAGGEGSNGQDTPNHVSGAIQNGRLRGGSRSVSSDEGREQDAPRIGDEGQQGW